jgi:alkylation response protein AidB-like acyl-CoA dehydrogenase
VATAARELTFPTPARVPNEEQLRDDVRAFLAAQDFEPACDAWVVGYDAEFSRRLAEAGYVGIAIPTEYGGHGRSPLERHIVIEELLATGAPAGAHWIADRQTAPVFLRFGTEEQRQRFLPRIARGECFFAIGMSEPDAGSDLAAIRTTATRTDGGWLVNGQKVWTSGAHKCHYVLTLVRTSPPSDDRHAGMTQMVIDLETDGLQVNPIKLMSGHHHFNEVVFDDVFVPDENVLGNVGDGWMQVTSELAYERSGPERGYSTLPLLIELIREVGEQPDPRQAAAIGRLVARLAVIRRLSAAVATALTAGDEVAVEAAVVKDIGTQHERNVADVARLVVAAEPSRESSRRFEVLLAEGIFAAPSFTLRGGTTEILRGIVARELGLR